MTIAHYGPSGQVSNLRLFRDDAIVDGWINGITDGQTGKYEGGIKVMQLAIAAQSCRCFPLSLLLTDV